MVRPSYSMDAAGGDGAGQRLGQPGEVPGAAGELETDQVGAQQALDDLGAPGQPHEQLDRRERDVQEEPDPHVGPQPAEQLRDELQLVVVHPDGRARRGEIGGRLGEPRVDLLVGLPPVAVELRFDDGIVIQRPQGLVGEALVVVVDLVAGQRDRDAGSSPSVVVGSRVTSGDPGQPIQAPCRRDRIGRQRGDQAAGRLPGLGAAVRQLLHVERQPVGNDDHLRLGGAGRVVRAGRHRCRLVRP